MHGYNLEILMAEIEYFYSAHSAYASLGSALLRKIDNDGGHVLGYKASEPR